MKILKWIGYTLLALVLLAAVLAYYNWEKLVRLNSVNTLFSEERIVSNFSNMDKAFYSVPIPARGDVEEWQISAKSLPQTFDSPLGTQNIKQWLEETATTSLLIVQDGKIAFEEYYLGTKADDLRISWSLAKSFLSAAFGVAVSEGRIDLDQFVRAYVPEFSTTAYRDVTVRNVLTMSSGVKFNEDYIDFWSDINKMGRVLALGGSMDEFALELEERVRDPGKVRQYVSIDTHVLAMVLRRVTGKTLPEYLAEKIITPIGFERVPYYLSDSEGNAFALGGLNVTTRDYARVGQMFLDNGRWNGEQIVPQDWANFSVKASAPAPEKDDGFGYGAQWWVPNGSQENGGDYEARGIYGQFIYVNPETRTVIVRTAANRKFRETLVDDLEAKHIYVDMFRTIARHMSDQVQ